MVRYSREPAREKEKTPCLTVQTLLGLVGWTFREAKLLGVNRSLAQGGHLARKILVTALKMPESQILLILT